MSTKKQKTKSRYVCKHCEESKFLIDFPRDSRNVIGYATNCCKSCKRTFYANEDIECDHCGKTVCKSALPRHKETKKCLEFGTFDDEKPWRQFKSNGTKAVTCPCDSCDGITVLERTAYRHLKQGSGSKESAADLRQRMRRSNMKK